MSETLLCATLQSLNKRGDTLGGFLKRRLQESGLELLWIDLFLSTKRIFALLHNGDLKGVFLHEAILSDGDFQRNGAPYFHFAPCAHVHKILNNPLDFSHYLVSLPRENRFDFKTTSGRSELRFFRGSPLEPCPLCKEIFSKDNQKSSKNFEDIVHGSKDSASMEEFLVLKEHLIRKGTLYEGLELLHEKTIRLIRNTKKHL